MKIKVAKERLDPFFEISRDIVIEVLNKLEEYKKHNTYFPKYRNYPEPFFKILKGTDTYEKLLKNFPPAKEGVQMFTTSSYKAPTNYKELLGIGNMSLGVNCTEIDKFNEFCKLLEINKDIAKMMYDVDGGASIQYKVLAYISTIVDRYIHLNSEDGFNEELMSKLIARKMARYFDETLYIKVCIPINFVLFPKSNIKVDNIFSIEKISEDMQISRYCACHYESEAENHVMENSAYMLVADNCSFENKRFDTYKKATENYWSYPKDKIDDFFAAMRIVKGCDTGYGQIVSEPIGWFDDACANMIELHGTTVRAFNRNLAEKHWGDHEYVTVSEPEVKKIIKIYNLINTIREKDKQEKEKEEKKRKENPNKKWRKEKTKYNRLLFAIKRLNRCMLREDEEDTAVDAVMGIEGLLSGSARSGLNYIISNRMAAVASIVDECSYSPSDARKAMKSIYGFRSAIVHGEELDEDKKYIKIGDSIVYAKDLAIEFLRYSLLFMLFNQKYLKSDKIDELLDECLSKKQDNKLD